MPKLDFWGNRYDDKKLHIIISCWYFESSDRTSDCLFINSFTICATYCLKYIVKSNFKEDFRKSYI